MTTALLDKAKYGPWAVIAGGSDGTGACFAHEVARSGINLLLIARRPAPLEAIASELRQKYPVAVQTLSLDLNAPGAARQMAEATKDLEIGLYISNAGADSTAKPFLDTPPEIIADLIARNVRTVTEACHHFGRLMRDRGRGGIVLMGSSTGLGGCPGFAAYGSTKAYILVLAESLWSEWRQAGVDVIGIAAPMMETPTLRRTVGNLQIPGLLTAEEVARDTLKRLPEGCSYVYVYGLPPEESDRQTAIRRSRVEAIEQASAALLEPR